MQWGTRQFQFIFTPTNHKRVMPANWRPCLCYPTNSPIATRLGLCSSLRGSQSPSLLVPTRDLFCDVIHGPTISARHLALLAGSLTQTRVSSQISCNLTPTLCRSITRVNHITIAPLRRTGEIVIWFLWCMNRSHPRLPGLIFDTRDLQMGN